LMLHFHFPCRYLGDIDKVRRTLIDSRFHFKYIRLSLFVVLFLSRNHATREVLIVWRTNRAASLSSLGSEVPTLVDKGASKMIQYRQYHGLVTY
jgi:hypothetical protein